MPCHIPQHRTAGSNPEQPKKTAPDLHAPRGAAIQLLQAAVKLHFVGGILLGPPVPARVPIHACGSRKGGATRHLSNLGASWLTCPCFAAEHNSWKSSVPCRPATACASCTSGWWARHQKRTAKAAAAAKGRSHAWHAAHTCRPGGRPHRQSLAHSIHGLIGWVHWRAAQCKCSWVAPPVLALRPPVAQRRRAHHRVPPIRSPPAHRPCRQKACRRRRRKSQSRRRRQSCCCGSCRRRLQSLGTAARRLELGRGQPFGRQAGQRQLLCHWMCTSQSCT